MPPSSNELADQAAVPASRPGIVPTQTPSAETPPEPSRRASSRTRRGFLTSPVVRASLTAVVFVAIFCTYGLWLGKSFLSVDGRLFDLHQYAPVLLLALAVLVTLIAGQFDLSVAATATLTTFLTVGLTVRQGLPFPLVLLACLAAGAIVGLVNGLVVVRLHVTAFIATLGTSGIVLGISSVYGGGTQIVPAIDGTPLPTWFSGTHSLGSFETKIPEPIALACYVVLAVAVVRAVARKRSGTSLRWTRIGAGALLVGAVAIGVLLHTLGVLASLSWTIAVLFAVAVVLWVLLERTIFGRNVAATGANPAAARLAGVRTERQIVLSFVVGGTIAAVAGVVLAAAQGSASPEGASAFMLPAFGAAFLSSVIFSAGRYNVVGTLLGGIFVVWVSQGLIIGGVPFTWSPVVNGAVLVGAVAMSTAFRRSR